MGVDQGIIKKSGAWFTYGEDRFQGREGFRQKLAEMDEMKQNLDKEIRTKLGMLKDGGDGKKEEADDKQKPKEKKSK